MTNLIDYIVDLFRDDSKAQSFVNNPTQALSNAGLPNVTPEQVQAVAAAAAPAGVSLADGDPVHSLQQAVAGYHSLPMADSGGDDSQGISDGQSHVANLDSLHSLAPEGMDSSGASGGGQVADAGFVSHDVQDLSDAHSVPDLASAPAAAASPGAGSGQFGGVNLDFGDITLGDKNTATGHAVANSGATQGSIVSGDGAVLGDHNDVNNGAIHTGEGSNMTMGGGVIHSSGTTAGGDVMTSGQGDVVKAAPGATTTVNDSSSQSHTVFGNESDTSTNMSGADIHGSVDASSHTDNSQHTDNSVHNTDSGNTDNSQHTDSHNTSTSDSHNNTVDTHLSASVPLF